MCPQLGEAFVFEYLRRTLGPDVVTLDCWVSGTRQIYYPDTGRGDDRLGYDMVVHDRTGALAGAPTTYYLEVKGQLSATKKTVYITDNEWRTCRSIHEASASLAAGAVPEAVYVVVIVCLAPDPVSILYWLENPYRLMNQGLLNVRPDRLAMVVNVPPLHMRGSNPDTGAQTLVRNPRAYTE